MRLLYKTSLAQTIDAINDVFFHGGKPGKSQRMSTLVVAKC